MGGQHKRRATLADVASKAGVSVMTVSNVVNGRSSIVRERTKQRVLQAIDALEYRPHPHARALRLSRSWTVGIMITSRMSDFPAAPWLSKVLSGLSNQLADRGYGLLLHNQDPDKIDEATLLKWSRTDGLVVLVSGSNSKRQHVLKRLAGLNQPIIALQEPNPPGSELDLAVIRQDDAGGGATLARHLAELFAKRFVFLRPVTEWPAMRERARGIMSVIKKTRGASLAVVQCADKSYSAVEASVLAQIRRDGLPDVFIGTNEFIAYSTLGVLEVAGYSVPHDVAVAGFNASELSRFAKRQITTIGFLPFELGTRAALAMLERLEGGCFSNSLEVLPAELIKGDTTRKTMVSF